MSWRYRDPRNFPAYFARTMRAAAASLETPQLLASSTTEPNLDELAANFRYFRWCIRQNPDVDRALGLLEALYDYRLSKDWTPNGVLLYLRARPTKLSELLTLNPDLIGTLAI